MGKILNFLINCFKSKDKKKPYYALRIVPAWFSDSYVEFEYTTNGFFWKKIYCANKPFLGHIDYDWTWEPLSYRLGNGSFKHEKEMFSTIEKVNEYHIQQRKRYEDGINETRKRRNEYYNQKQTALKRANS